MRLLLLLLLSASPRPIDREGRLLVRLTLELAAEGRLVPLAEPTRRPRGQLQDNLHAVLERVASLRRACQDNPVGMVPAAVTEAELQSVRQYLDTSSPRCEETFAPVWFDPVTGGLRPGIRGLDELPQAMRATCKPLHELLSCLR